MLAEHAAEAPEEYGSAAAVYLRARSELDARRQFGNHDAAVLLPDGKMNSVRLQRPLPEAVAADVAASVRASLAHRVSARDPIHIEARAFVPVSHSDVPTYGRSLRVNNVRDLACIAWRAGMAVARRHTGVALKPGDPPVAASTPSPAEEHESKSSPVDSFMASGERSTVGSSCHASGTPPLGPKQGGREGEGEGGSIAGATSRPHERSQVSPDALPAVICIRVGCSVRIGSRGSCSVAVSPAGPRAVRRLEAGDGVAGLCLGRLRVVFVPRNGPPEMVGSDADAEQDLDFKFDSDSMRASG